MPVFEWDLDLQASEWDWREATGSLPDICDVSVDFWRKFEELPDLGDDLESLLLESAACHNDPSNVLRHHDCMWAGTCLSKEHKNFVSNPLPNTIQQSTPPPPQAPQTTTTVRQPISDTPITTVTSTVTTTTNQVNKTSPEKPKRESRRKGVIVQKTVGRSLLINSRSRIPEPTRPDTPPSLSESEEDEKKTISVVPVSEITNQVSIRKPPQQQSQQLQTTNLYVQFDHNYDKVRIDDLGVQTPSDSEEEETEEEGEGDEEEEEEEEEEEDDDEEDDVEQVGDVVEEQVVEDSDEEEIDVVSLNNTSGIIRIRNQPNTLPYNPSRELCRELQDTMASAITTNKLLSVNRSTSRRKTNGNGKRKRKRDDSDDDEDDDNDDLLMIQQQQIQQQTLINSRIRPNNSTISSTYTTTTTPKYHHQHHRKNWRRTSNTPKKSRFSIDSELDCEKRSLHNNMERMRRIGLRNAFEDLRVLVPSLKESKRAAKVNILKESADFVRHLTVKERGLSQQVVSLRLEQEKLRARLSKLRRSLAAHR